MGPRSFAASFTLLLLGASALAATGDALIVTGNGVNVRAGPSGDAAVRMRVHRVVLVAFPPAAQGPFAHPMIPILASLSTRPNPHSKFLGTVPEPDRSRAP